MTWTKGWNFTPENFAKLAADDMIYWGSDGTACPTKKLYLKAEMTKPFGTMLDPAKVGYTGWGGKALKALGFDKELFPYAKPVELIAHLLEIATKPDSVILDFFAGSGTTGEAVFRLNRKDGGTRRVILCNSDENDICARVTHPRVVAAKRMHGERRNVEFCRVRLDVAGPSAPLIERVVGPANANDPAYQLSSGAGERTAKRPGRGGRIRFDDGGTDVKFHHRAVSPLVREHLCHQPSWKDRWAA